MDQLCGQSSIVFQFRHHLDRYSFGFGCRTSLPIQTFGRVDCNRQVVRYCTIQLINFNVDLICNQILCDPLDRKAQCLHLDCALVLLLTLRRSFTWLRSRGMDWLLPLDRTIYFHKMIGWLICVFSVVHTLAHIINYGK